MLSEVWRNAGVAVALVWCGALLAWALMSAFRRLSALCSRLLSIRLGAGLFAVVAAVAYGGSKPAPTTYGVLYVDATAEGGAVSQQFEQGRVYNLLSPEVRKGGVFVGWACSNGRRYDDGVLVFDLAKPSETVTMTAIWESGSEP